MACKQMFSKQFVSISFTCPGCLYTGAVVCPSMWQTLHPALLEGKL